MNNPIDTDRSIVEEISTRLASGIVAASTIGRIMEGLDESKVPDAGQTMLERPFHSLGDGIHGIYAGNHLATLKPGQSMLVVATNDACMAIGINLDGLLKDDVLDNAPDVDIGDFWLAIHEFVKEGNTGMVVMASMLRFGRERLTQWKEALDKGRDSGLMPVLIAVVGANKEEASDLQEVCGLFSMAVMPKSLPAVRGVQVEESPTIH